MLSETSSRSAAHMARKKGTLSALYNYLQALTLLKEKLQLRERTEKSCV